MVFFLCAAEMAQLRRPGASSPRESGFVRNGLKMFENCGMNSVKQKAGHEEPVKEIKSFAVNL